MEIQVSETSYCKLNVHYEADKDQIDSKRNEVLTYFKKAPVKGFRTGKANIEVIKIQYKKQIEEALKRALAEEAFHSTMFEKNIKPLGQPDFTAMLLQQNTFSCDFTINKKPDFELSQYKNFDIPKSSAELSADALAEKMLEEMRYEYGDMVPYEENDVVEDGDRIIVVYEATVDGLSDPALSTEGEMITIGSNPIKEFDNNILGMKVGETKEFDISLSENINSLYKNKVLKFKLTVSIGSKVNKMPLNDALAVKVGKTDLNDLRSYVYSLASSKLEETSRNKLIEQINARLLENHSFTVPDWLSLSEAQYLVANSRKQWNDLKDEDKELFLKAAESNVKLALILDRIREEEPEAQLSDQEVIEIIKQNIAKSNQNMDQVLQEMNNNGYLPILIARLRDESTLDFVLKNSNIVE